jgi:hypothetical protein
VFLEFPKLDGSAVYFACEQNVRYIVNSEGTLARVGRQEYKIQIFGGDKRESGEDVYDQLTYTTASFDKLPSKEELMDAIRKLCKKLQTTNDVEFEDEYSGPVLFADVAVADLFSATLFGYRDRLIASDAIPDPKSTRKESGLESKMEKSIISDHITIKAKTPMKSFKGQEVLGAYLIDNEGVQPPSELVLVDKGILKGLLNDRTVVNPVQSSNGHDDGPAVVEVTFDNAQTFDQLKKKLIELARAEDLEYGVMVKNKMRGQGMSREVYRVYVKDGREELVPKASVEPLSLKNLKKDVLASNELLLHNIEAGPSGTVSYIVPTAVLIPDVEVRKVETTGYKQEEYIPSPLVK